MNSSPATPAEHRIGIAAIVACAVMWSIAGIVTRHASVTNGWEVTFWRSLFVFVFILVVLVARDRGEAIQRVSRMGWHGLVSGAMWAVMFTCFMLALTRTTVANTLFINGLLPFFAAIAGWLALRERVPGRTWVAMIAAFAGMAMMFADAFRTGNLGGSLIALGVPIAAAINVVVVKHARGRVDLVPAVMLGGLLSALATLPAAHPFTASATDLALFATLGVVQLGLPGMLYVLVAVPRLSAAEVGLLSLLEVVLGPLWVWLGVGEQPSPGVLLGGAVVLGAIVVNETIALLRERARLGREAS